MGLLGGWSQVQKHFSDLLMQTINFGLEGQPYLFVFNSASFGFFAFFRALGSGLGSKALLGPNYVGY